jgi:hypothetical protein
MLLGLSAGALVSYRVTGSTLPTNPRDALIFQNGLLLIVLGCALVEYKFTKPADSVVNSLAGMMTLFGVYYLTPRLAWWSVFSYCALVFVAASLCVSVSAGPHVKNWQRKVADLTYRPSVFFGRARLLYSSGVSLSFYGRLVFQKYFRLGTGMLPSLRRVLDASSGPTGPISCGSDFIPVQLGHLRILRFCGSLTETTR